MARTAAPLARSLPHGNCVATDSITLDGHPVGIMYRDEPEDPRDSGWRFTAGFETVEYVDDSDNCGVYDLGTIARHDPAILPFLDAPAGSAFERDEASGTFLPIQIVFSDDN